MCGLSLEQAADRLTTADIDHLRAYLPANLVETLQMEMAAPPTSLWQQCNNHLARLLKAAASHLPPYLVEQVAQNPIPGQTNGRFMQGTLLFADISGFTAMSERLSRIGREGAEEVTIVVNRYFEVMLTILRQNSGQLIKFGGDALLGLFAEPPEDSATRAIQAALQMQAAMADFSETQTSQGTFPLQMKVAIHYGRFFAAQLGNAQNMEYALFGCDVNQTANLESAAVAGQIVTDTVTLDRVNGEVTAVALNDQHHIIQALDAPPPPSPPAPLPLLPDLSPNLATLHRAVKLLDTLTPYLPSGLLSRLASDPTAPTLVGEHRLVAILFTNLHGLGDIADQLGPGCEEEIITALNQIFVAFTTALEQYGGVINKIDLYDHGDKMLAFFGAPIAHEDDAERSVRAALQIQQALNDLNNTLPASVGLPDLHLSQHIGISYGYVFAGFVGADWRREYTVMGDEVNLAARLMTTAEAGSSIVSRNVQRKVQALFELPSRGEVQLKGKQNPIPIYKVAGPRAVPEPLRGLKGMHSPLVGRETEWQQLQAALGQLFQSRGQIASIMGEAGLGKSRLVSELRRLTTENLQFAHIGWVEGRCLSYTENVSYWPFHEALHHLVKLSPDDDASVAINKLHQALEQWLSPSEAWDTLPYMANFLNLELPEELDIRVRYLDAEALQRRTFVALRTLLEAQARELPLILVLDDLHWLDKASARLLEFLLPLVNKVPVMFILMFRPERTKVCWQLHEKASREFDYCYTQITLNLLDTADTEQLLNNLVGLSEWPSGVRELIFSRTEGNPLYLEEVLRTLINSDVLAHDNGTWRLQGDATAVSVPDTLQGVMMARLDRLQEPSRRTAQMASVVGRSFPFDLITSVTPEVINQTITPQLVQLQQYEIIQETQRLPEIVYAFKHTLMQEVCYRSLSTRARNLYHQQIAHYLAENQIQNSGEARATLPLIAHHAYAGQDWPMAILYQILAGRQAQKLFANEEAFDHFRKALTCSEYIPKAESQESLHTIHAALGELLVVTSQYDEAQSHLEQAYTLAEALGAGEAQAFACRWLARSYELRGEYASAFEWIDKGLAALSGQETAEAAQILLIAGLIHTRQGNRDKGFEICQQALEMAEHLGELTALARANTLLGHMLRAQGEGGTAVAHFQQAIELYEQAGDINGQATALNQMAVTYLTSDWQQAEQHFRQARLMYNQIGDMYHQVFVENNLAEILLKRGELAEAIELYQAALEAMEEIGGSAYVLGALHNNLGAAYVRQGDAETARHYLGLSRELFDKAQARDFLPELHRHLAEATLLTGDLTLAETKADEALALARELAMPAEEASSLRVLGDIALQRGETAVALEKLEASVAILTDVADEYQLAHSHFSLAQAYKADGQMGKAQEVATACLVVFERLSATMDVTAVRALQQTLVNSEQ